MCSNARSKEISITAVAEQIQLGETGGITMAAYVIVDIDVTDPIGYEEYKKLAGQTAADFGGKYLTRGGKVETLEGTWAPKRLVILEFDSVERAKEWLESPVYREAKQVRYRTAKSNMIVVEGV
jgi:uncharacterized protein (DUF1330 family)